VRLTNSVGNGSSPPYPYLLYRASEVQLYQLVTIRLVVPVSLCYPSLAGRFRICKPKVGGSNPSPGTKPLLSGPET
jgi:hypothetical protein